MPDERDDYDGPVIVRYDDGRQFEVASPEAAADLHPEATIAGRAPVGAYDGPSIRTILRRRKEAEAPAKKAKPAPETPARTASEPAKAPETDRPTASADKPAKDGA